MVWSIILFFSVYSSVNAEVKDTILTFDEGMFTIERVDLSNEGFGLYSRIKYLEKNKQFRCVETPGHPELPVHHVVVSLPFNAENISVSGENSYFSSRKIEYRIYPVQYPAATGMGYEKPLFCKEDSSVYVEQYPRSILNVTGISCFKNREKLVGIDVYPVVYHPFENRYEIVKRTSVHVSYTREQERRKSPSFERSIVNLPFYKFCIITPRKFKKAFDRFVAWERQKGLSTGVICTEDIFANQAIKGDTVSQLYDNAGKIRQYLQYAYEYGGAEYVLLGGNDSIVPIRYGTGSNNATSYQNDPEALHIPSDFYYAELNSNWNKDKDLFYGEPQDIVDYAAELKVGRLLCTKTEDIENYTDKLLRYELNPGNGDFSYLQKAFYSQADQMQADLQANKMSSSLENIFPYKVIVSEEPGYNAPNTIYPTGNDALAVLKEHFGFACWYNHGHPMAITVKSNNLRDIPYGITSVTADVPWGVRENCNGLDSLNNKFYPMVVYSTSCTITPFDMYSDEYKYQTNIGQSFTQGKDYGGPALIGNTRVGWVNSSFKMQEVFNRYFPYYSIGEALNLAKYSNINYQHHHALVVNIIGSPNVNIWTSTPQRFNATLTDGYLKTTASDEVYISRYSLINGKSYIDKVTLESGTMKLSDTSNSVITLNKRNWLPQILPVSINDAEISGENAIVASDVSIGTVGKSVSFTNKSKTLIEKSGVFSITGNTVIAKGATFVVRQSSIIK